MKMEGYVDEYGMLTESEETLLGTQMCSYQEIDFEGKRGMVE